jgi:ATP-dependent DNA helicase RecG
MLVVKISRNEADKLLAIQEGQFSEVKAIVVSPANLTKILSAFGNSDGGDLYIGIDEVGPAKFRQWRGFDDQESANGCIQAFEQLFPLGQDCSYEFLRCDDYPGLVLHAQVLKTKRIVKATNSIAYSRRGAQSLPVSEPEAIRRLEYSKGLTSFESESINVDGKIITESAPAQEFIREVVPKTTPEAWLKKQLLLTGDGKPTVAGLLLFAEEPQALLPKRSGIKVYRYKTTAKEGFRDVLAFTPRTVEGWLYKQIRDAVEATTEEVEKISKMGKSGLEAIVYPHEALHEIITNAVIHRDYSVADDVHIRIFDNRVEVENPGRLPAHITVNNILTERFARNGAVVRILNKFPDAPNKDVGEGLNTAFAAMNKLGLKEPVIKERENAVLVTLKHEPLASAEEAIMDYLATHEWINNKKAREVTHITEDFRIRATFRRMEAQGMIERAPGSVTSNTRYRKKAVVKGSKQKGEK